MKCFNLSGGDQPASDGLRPPASARLHHHVHTARTVSRVAPRIVIIKKKTVQMYHMLLLSAWASAGRMPVHPMRARCRSFSDRCCQTLIFR